MARTNFKNSGIEQGTKLQIIKKPKKQSEKFKKFDDGYDGFIERKIIIGLIVSDEFGRWFIDNFQVKYIGSPTARILANWCIEYYKGVNQAPRADIETIYFKKLKERKISKDVAEEIEEDILPSLSKEYEHRAINIEYLKKNAERHLQFRTLEVAVETAEALLHQGEINKAAELVNIDLPFTNDLSHFIRSVGEMEKAGVKRPKLLMKPWLREGETTILYSKAGVGKSLLAILIAFILGLKNYTDETSEIGKWQVKQPTGTLYIDGELGNSEMLDRIKKFCWIGEQQYPMKVLSIPEYQVGTEKDLDLSKRDSQRKIINWLKNNPNYKFLIIDSISTVFNLNNENDNSEWNKKINPFLKDLRALNVAHIIQHHSGKDGKQGLRGASAISAMAHNIIRLTDHPKKQAGTAWFKIDNKEKQRAAGKLYDSFYIQFFPQDEKTIWRIEDDAGSDDRYLEMVKDFVTQDLGNKEIAEKYGYKKSENLFHWKKKAVKDGFLDDKYKPTSKGYDLINKME